MRARAFRHFGLFVRLAVILAALTVISHADAGETVAATVTVNVGDNWFCSSSFSTPFCPRSIQVGGTVTWSWVGFNAHTSTACSDATFNNCGAAQGWDSGTKGNGGTFSRTFDIAGSFFYRCQIHTGMHGRIDVALDTDADGWSDGVETLIGTDPADACANTPAANDETDDRWPADLNDDKFSDGTDITILAGSFGKAVPAGAPRRRDIGPANAPDGFSDGTDITVLAGYFGKGCN
jgi:plastocyanin